MSHSDKKTTFPEGFSLEQKEEYIMLHFVASATEV